MLELTISCAVVAYVYVNVLVKPGNILHWWARLLEWALVKETLDPYSRKESWLYKPLLGCDKCMAGQLALWSSVFSGYGAVSIVKAVCTAILFIILIKASITKCEN